jgi:hypothetical protein
VFFAQKRQEVSSRQDKFNFLAKFSGVIPVLPRYAGMTR